MHAQPLELTVGLPVWAAGKQRELHDVVHARVAACICANVVPKNSAVSCNQALQGSSASQMATQCLSAQQGVQVQGDLKRSAASQPACLSRGPELRI